MNILKRSQPFAQESKSDEKSIDQRSKKKCEHEVNGREKIGFVALEHTDPENSKATLIEWTLGSTCQYSCSYCPPELHDGRTPWISLDKITTFLKLVDTHFIRQLNPNVWIQYTGGEPTLYPKFLDLLAAGNRLGFKQSIISNGARTLNYWHKAKELLQNIHLTYHHAQADQKHFLNTIECLQEHCQTHVNLTMIPETFDEIFQFGLLIRNSFDRVTLTFKPLRKNFGTELYPYSLEQIEKMRTVVSPKIRLEKFCRGTMTKVWPDSERTSQKANHYILEDSNHWKDWWCRAGVELLVIKPNGDIYRGMCRVGGLVGNVGDNTLNLPTQSIQCTKESCNCVMDILTTKTKDPRAWSN